MNSSSLTWKFHGSTGIQIIEIHSLCRDLRRWNVAIIQSIVCNPAGDKRMEFRRRSRQKSRSSHFWHRFSRPFSNLDSRIGKSQQWYRFLYDSSRKTKFLNYFYKRYIYDNDLTHKLSVWKRTIFLNFCTNNSFLYHLQTLNCLNICY